MPGELGAGGVTGELGAGLLGTLGAKGLTDDEGSYTLVGAGGEAAGRGTVAGPVAAGCDAVRGVSTAGGPAGTGVKVGGATVLGGRLGAGPGDGGYVVAGGDPWSGRTGIAGIRVGPPGALPLEPDGGYGVGT